MERNFIRPMRIGEIFDSVFFILRKNFKTLVNLNLILFLPAFILGLLAVIGAIIIYFVNPMIFEGFKNPKPDFALIGLVVLGIGFFVLFIIIISVTFLFNAYGVFQVFDASINGRQVTWKESLKGSLRGVLFFFLSGLFVGAVSMMVVFPISMGLSVFSTFNPDPTAKIIFAIGNNFFSFITRTVLSAFIYVALPIIALEKKDPFTSLWRSCCLVWKNFWRTVGVYLFFVLMTLCMYLVSVSIIIAPFLIMISQFGKDFFKHFDVMMLFNPWVLITGFLLLTVLLFLGFVFYNAGLGLQVMVLYDLRMRSEGYDIIPPETTDPIQTV